MQINEKLVEIDSLPQSEVILKPTSNSLIEMVTNSGVDAGESISITSHVECSRLHKENRLEINQAQNSVEFRDQIKYEVPLNDIYEV